MKNGKGNVSLKLLISLILLGFVSIFLIYNIGVSYATGSQDTPDVSVVVERNGQSTQEGNLFGNAIWYPGYEKSGTIRISSKGGLSVNKLGLNVSLIGFREEFSEQAVYDSFVDNMRLTVKKGHLMAFNQTLINNESLSQLISGGGIELGGLDRLIIASGGFIDLMYTLGMDYEAGEELQDVSANITFQINMNGNPEPTTEPGSPSTGQPAAKPDYDGHWAHNCIETLIKYKILEPYEDGTIRPDNYITRAETAVLLGKALKLEDMADAPSPYKDAIPDSGRGYIISTYKAGVYKGYPGPIFRAEQEIPREQMAAVLVRAFNLSLRANHDLNFTDTDEISSWAVEEVKKAVENQVITGYPDRSFRPKDRITRAEAFTIVCKLLKYHPEH